jgi:hypothetical protein
VWRLKEWAPAASEDALVALGAIFPAEVLAEVGAARSESVSLFLSLGQAPICSGLKIVICGSD